MMTEIGEITVGTLLKRVKPDNSSCITMNKTYEVVRIDSIDSFDGVRVINDHGKEWWIEPTLYKIVGHIDDDIIEELDQMLELCLKYNELESYIVSNA